MGCCSSHTNSRPGCVVLAFVIRATFKTKQFQRFKRLFRFFSFFFRFFHFAFLEPLGKKEEKKRSYRALFSFDPELVTSLPRRNILTSCAHEALHCRFLKPFKFYIQCKNFLFLSVLLGSRFRCVVLNAAPTCVGEYY